MAEQNEVKKGWFHTPGRTGDRHLDEQLIGLDKLFVGVTGKTILDVGCAEGLITLECVKRGALFARGAEIVKDHVDVANAFKRSLSNPKLSEKLDFIEADANVWEPEGRYDVVLLLAVLHKLRDPCEAAKRFASAANERVVVRWPIGSLGVIVDGRSGGTPHKVSKAIVKQGFEREHDVNGPRGEWLTYFRRR